MWLMASGRPGATEMYLILGHWIPGFAGMVFRKITSSSTLSMMRWMAGPEQHAMGGAGGNIPGAANLYQRLSRVAQRTAGIHHVVQKDDVLIPHITDDIHDLGGVGLLAALVHDGQGHIQLLGKGPGPGHGAYVGRHDHSVIMAGGVLLGKVLHKDGGAQQIVHWDIKEALDLVGVQVHGQHPVRSRRR